MNPAPSHASDHLATPSSSLVAPNLAPNLVEALEHLLGAAHVLTGADTAPYCTDWRKRYHGQALAVVKPANTEEVAAVVKLCRQYRVSMVPQGGNTGLSGGATPDNSGQQIVMSLTRLNQIRQIDSLNNTLTVEAGCILQHVQQAATQANRLFPLSLAAEGSCTLGGNLATNAGGTAVLRFGNTRELCLGLEVVTAQGDIWHGLRGLRKDNTGYDLRDLFIGTEGTLGIITAATLKLFPRPQAQITALAAVPDLPAALALLTLAQRHCSASLTAFEIMSAYCLELVAQYFPAQMPPFATRPAYAVLLEVSDHESEQHAQQLFESLMQQALQAGCIQDAVVAASIAQSHALWQLRESIPLAQAKDGLNIKHDIALPLSNMAAFIHHTNEALLTAFPGVRQVIFGHLGDGNLHYNVAAPLHQNAQDFLTQEKAVNHLVYEQVAAYQGSISAEHGLGQLKRDTIQHYKSEVELQLMRAIKQAFDPDNLMNPGKVIG